MLFICRRIFFSRKEQYTVKVRSHGNTNGQPRAWVHRADEHQLASKLVRVRVYRSAVLTVFM